MTRQTGVWPGVLATLALLAGCASDPGKGLETANPRREGERVDAKPAPAEVAGGVEPEVAAPEIADEDRQKRDEAVRRYNEGALAERQGRHKDAFDHYNAAVKHWPRYAPAHVGIGNLFLMRQRYAEAEQAYRTALKTDPRNPTAHNNLAWLFVVTKTDLPKGVELARKGVDLTQALLQQAMSGARLEEAGRLRGELAECWSTLAWCYFHLGDHLAAAMAWDSALGQLASNQKAQKATYLYRMALSLSMQGEASRARQSIQQARALGPDEGMRGKLDALEASLQGQ